MGSKLGKGPAQRGNESAHSVKNDLAGTLSSGLNETREPSEKRPSHSIDDKPTQQYYSRVRAGNVAHSPGDKELSYSPLRSSYGRRKQLLQANDPGLKQFSPKGSMQSKGKLRDNQSNSKHRT